MNRSHFGLGRSPGGRDALTNSSCTGRSFRRRSAEKKWISWPVATKVQSIGRGVACRLESPEMGSGWLPAPEIDNFEVSHATPGKRP